MKKEKSNSELVQDNEENTDELIFSKLEELVKQKRAESAALKKMLLGLEKINKSQLDNIDKKTKSKRK